MTEADKTVPVLCPACHQALDAHFNALLSTYFAASTPAVRLMQRFVLLIKHHILDGDVSSGRFTEALRALDKAKGRRSR